jgi:hypothetical protein
MLTMLSYMSVDRIESQQAIPSADSWLGYVGLLARNNFRLRRRSGASKKEPKEEVTSGQEVLLGFLKGILH